MAEAHSINAEEQLRAQVEACKRALPGLRSRAVVVAALAELLDEALEPEHAGRELIVDLIKAASPLEEQLRELQTALTPSLRPAADLASEVGEVCVKPDLEDEETAPAPSTVSMMVVDDEDRIRHLICRILRRAGYEPLEAGDGVEALRLLETLTSPLDVLVTDDIMPNMGGIQLAQTLWGHGLVHSIIFLTGSVVESCVVEGAPAEAVQVLFKPFSRETLLASVRAALKASLTIRELPSIQDRS